MVEVHLMYSNRAEHVRIYKELQSGQANVDVAWLKRVDGMITSSVP